MLPQDEALDILVEFLHAHGYEKVKGIDLETIPQLAAIVLQENVFVYDKKIYKQILGGTMGFIIYIDISQYIYVEMAKRIRTSTRYIK